MRIVWLCWCIHDIMKKFFIWLKPSKTIFMLQIWWYNNSYILHWTLIPGNFILFCNNNKLNKENTFLRAFISSYFLIKYYHWKSIWYWCGFKTMALFICWYIIIERINPFFCESFFINFIWFVLLFYFKRIFCLMNLLKTKNINNCSLLSLVIFVCL